MKSIEIIGYKRANLGKKEARKLREQSNIPCVMYGGKEQIHFYAPAYLLKKLIFTPHVYMADVYIEKVLHKCIVQDVQFNPVTDVISHVDFLEVKEDEPVKMQIPVKLQGTSIGVTRGGKLVQKMKKLKVKALPSKMPDYVEVDISNLDIGKSAKVGDIKTDGYEILNNKSIPVASVLTTRALKQEEAANAEAKAGDSKAPAAKTQAKAPTK
ncbi:MAG: 50S ribosomal protein L25/general stress protein Ctc [Cytophagaceae bacterium]|nr:50S ribosomal protein L25/general stress protein Ctc [Cytophagaceae bacterium]MDW8456363.1 50S ribosomal protein L25/general stress protein Ctc [Cytophagaceae bacterium]